MWLQVLHTPMMRQSKKVFDSLGIKQANVLPSSVKGLKTVLTDSGVLYVSEDDKHILHGLLYDISGKVSVNVTNQLLVTQLEALQDQVIVYKAPKEKHVITVFIDSTCGYCHKLYQQMHEYNNLGITVRYLAFPRQGKGLPGRERHAVDLSAVPTKLRLLPPP